MKKRLFAAALFLIFSVSFSGCNSKDMAAAPLPEDLTFTMNGIQEDIPGYDAHDIIGTYENDTCYNITPEAVSKGSEFTIYKYDPSFTSYLLFDDTIYPLGTLVGGYGVLDMKLVDIDRDGMSEMFFTFSSGSGIHTSSAAYFNPATRETTSLHTWPFGAELMFIRDTGGGLSLYSADITIGPESVANYTLEAGDLVGNIVVEKGIASFVPVK